MIGYSNIFGSTKGRGVRLFDSETLMDLSTKSVVCASLALEDVDDIHGGDGLSFGVLALLGELDSLAFITDP